MQSYSFSEARQNLATVLDVADKEGAIRINRKDGQAFILKPVPVSGFSLNIKAINVDITTDYIADIVRKGREDRYRYE